MTSGQKLVGKQYSEAPVYERSAQGWSVAVSGDGLTLAVGDNRNDGSTGCTWIYGRNNLSEKWLLQTNRMIGTNASPPSQQGFSVALSDDGNTLAVGGPYDNNHMGAVWIFHRIRGNWEQFGQKLVGANPIGTSINALRGYAVVLSGDGKTLAFGGPRNNYYASTRLSGTDSIGATWVFGFDELKQEWIEQARLRGGVRKGYKTEQGASLALSYDGNILAVGGRADASLADVFIFVRIGGYKWYEQAHEIFFTAEFLHDAQVGSVSLSSDGKLLAVGGRSQDVDNGNPGAIVWLFAYNNDDKQWVLQSRITAGDRIPNVKLSGDGTKLLFVASKDKLLTAWNYQRDATGQWVMADVTFQPPVKDDYPKLAAIAMAADRALQSFVIGEPTEENEKGGIGAVYHFAAGHNYAPKLIAPDYLGRPEQGTSVSVSKDGKTLALGGPNDGNGVGAVWIFSLSTDKFWVQTAMLKADNAVGASNQGGSVALSADGNLLIVGGRGDGANGAVWMWGRGKSDNWSQLMNLRPYADKSLFGIGWEVAISDDGSVVAFTAIEAVWVFSYVVRYKRWIQLCGRLTIEGALSIIPYGISLSGNGKRLAVGYVAENISDLTTQLFSSSGDSWTAEKTLIGKRAASYASGTDVSLDYEGAVLAVGPGAISLFELVDRQWLLFEKDLDAAARSLALSGDGKTLVVGNLNGNLSVYRRSSNWALSEEIGDGGSEQAVSCGVSSNGSVIVCGKNHNEAGVGAGLVYQR